MEDEKESYGDDPLDVIVKEEICDEVPEVEVKLNDKKVPTISYKY